MASYFTSSAKDTDNEKVVPSAPSPSSMPEVVAAEVVKYNIRCIKEKDSILLKIKDNITKRDYRVTIQEKDNDSRWSSFKKYYQNDFEKFYQSLELCIEGNIDGLTCNIIEAQNKVIMDINYTVGGRHQHWRICREPIMHSPQLTQLRQLVQHRTIYMALFTPNSRPNRRK